MLIVQRSAEYILARKKYAITFTVTAGASPVAGARIVLNGRELFTNTSGVAVFRLMAGTYVYQITAPSYATVTDEVIVTGTQSVPVDIITKLTPYNLDVPDGWLVPTADEWEAERLSWGSNNRAGAFASPLKLTVGGLRATSGGVAFAGSVGLYATQSISTINVSYLGIDSLSAEISVESRGFGSSVRLIKQTSLPLVTGNQTFTYNGSSWTYREVESAGRIWMDRNLGASQVASAFNDALAYGDLFQWGRNIDGHQARTSGTTETLSNSDTPGHGDFITTSVAPNDWRNPQNDNLWQAI